MSASSVLALSAMTSSSRMAEKILSSKNRLPRRAQKRKSMAVFFPSSLQ